MSDVATAPAPGAAPVDGIDPRQFNLTKAAYSVDEATDVLSIGRRTLEKAVAENRLQARKEGTRTLFLAGDLARYLANLQRVQRVRPAAA